jgi:hypothetical protein
VPARTAAGARKKAAARRVVPARTAAGARKKAAGARKKAAATRTRTAASRTKPRPERSGSRTSAAARQPATRIVVIQPVPARALPPDAAPASHVPPVEPLLGDLLPSPDLPPVRVPTPPGAAVLASGNGASAPGAAPGAPARPLFRPDLVEPVAADGAPGPRLRRRRPLRAR